MDFKAYQEMYFTQPAPKPRFAFRGIYGIALFYQDYEAAVRYYQQVLGPPAYVEGDSTKGWQIGNSWLTLLRGKEGNPRNLDFNIVMTSPQEADRLQLAFIEAGGSGAPPHNDLMYEPVHICPVTDPWGTAFLIICPLANEV